MRETWRGVLRYVVNAVVTVLASAFDEDDGACSYDEEDDSDTD